MKKFILLLLMLSGTSLFHAEAQNGFNDHYDRIGLTSSFITYGGRHADLIKQALEEVPLQEKFYDNPVGKRIIRLRKRQEKKEKFLNTQDENKRIEAIRDFLNKNHLGRVMVAHWYNYDPREGFDLSRVFERAEYNATDEEIFVSRNSKRGKARIRDYGHTLVSNSYLAVIDLRGIEKDVSREGDYANISYQSEMGVYLFKLQFGEKQIDQLFNVWFYKDDPPEIKEKKAAAFQRMDFPLQYVMAEPEAHHITGKARYSMIDEMKGEELNIKELNSKAFNQMIEESYEKMQFQASKKVEAFKVKKKVMGVHPIQAKIGKKESLKTDDKYFVYEYQWDEELDKAVAQRKAVIRAKKVADNRGNQRSKRSRFYQIYGGTIDEGMVLREHPDWGISLTAGYEQNGLGGMSFQGRWRMGRVIGIPALYLVGGLGFTSSDYGGLDRSQYTYLENFEQDKVSFYRFDVGLGKGFQIVRFIELTPFIAAGMNNTEDDQQEYDYSAFYYKTGLAAGINLLHNLQAFGQFNYYGMGEVTVSDKDGNVMEEMGGESWSDEFPDQEGGTGIELGLRYEF